jgi:hypothetical protein
MARIIDAFSQFFDGAGDPLVNGKLKFVGSGTNNTDKTTYKDSDLTIPNTNPVLLDGEGRCPNVFGEGVYKIFLYTEDDVQIQVFDPVGGVLTDGAFGDWDANTSYGSGDIVTGTNGKYYRSITNNNQNNNPVSSPENWEVIKFISEWNTNQTYIINDVAQGSDGLLYISKTNTNIGNDPTVDTINWFKEGSTPDNAEWPRMEVNALDEEHDIDFISGRILSSDGTLVISGDSLTKQIDNTWTEGDNGGGNFAGAVAADTAYGCFIILKESDGTVDYGFDTDAAASNIPAGYTAYRRIGWVITDATANVIGFQQRGDYFLWNEQILDLNTTNPSANLQSVVVSVPPNTIGDFITELQDALTETAVITTAGQSDLSPLNANHTLRTGSSSQLSTVAIQLQVNENSQIRHHVSSANVDGFRIITRGFIDQRIN